MRAPRSAARAARAPAMPSALSIVVRLYAPLFRCNGRRPCRLARYGSDGSFTATRSSNQPNIKRVRTIRRHFPPAAKRIRVISPGDTWGDSPRTWHRGHPEPKVARIGHVIFEWTGIGDPAHRSYRAGNFCRPRNVIIRRKGLSLRLRLGVAMSLRRVVSFTGVMLSFLLAGCGGPAHQTSATSSAPSSSTTLPAKVTTGTAPSGWLPVSYGDAQLSVPSSWALISSGAAECGPNTGAVILGSGQWCPSSMNVQARPNTSIVTLKTVSSYREQPGSPAFIANGIPVYARGVAPVYVIPALGIELTISGPSQTRVLHTLTFSPRAVALAPGSSVPAPKSWRWISFAGIRFAVPPHWAVKRTPNAPPCGTDLVLSEAGVDLASGPALPVPCPLPMADVRPVPQVPGVEVDDFSGASSQGPCVSPGTINGLNICIEGTPAFGVLIAETSSAGHRPVTMKIGMFGSGTDGRTILYSIRRSGR
jgi:hypothetical protein